MEYKIIWDPKAIEAMEKLEKVVSVRVALKVDSIKDEPLRFAERLSGDKLYKLRIGDYRAILEIDSNNKEITIMLVGHRSVIYKILGRAA